MIGNIYISGLIGTIEEDGKPVKGVELIDIITQVKKQPDALSFDVHINSEGGVVDTGFEIYDYLRSLGKPIKTIGNVLVASIATVIFMAGDTRIIKQGTQFMIHMPLGGFEYAASHQIESYLEGLKQLEKRIVDFYKKTTGLEVEAIEPLLRNETWLTEAQLKDLGFTTEALMPFIAKTYLKTNKKSDMTEADKNWFESLFKPLMAKFKKPANKLIQDATGAELDFTELADGDTIEVGATANIAGSPADGEFTLPDGTVYVFSEGSLTEIREPEGETELDIANARIVELEAEVASITARAETSENRVVDIEKDVVALKKQVMSKFKVEGKKETKPPGEDKLAGMKEYLNKK